MALPYETLGQEFALHLSAESKVGFCLAVSPFLRKEIDEVTVSLVGLFHNHISIQIAANATPSDGVF